MEIADPVLLSLVITSGIVLQYLKMFQLPNHRVTSFGRATFRYSTVQPPFHI